MFRLLFTAAIIYLKRIIVLLSLLTPVFIQGSNGTKTTFQSIYEELKGNNKPEFVLFEKAYLGYIDLKLSGIIPSENHIFSIVDFRLPSTQKRLWIIDLESKVILFNTYVAHGENSGKEYALNFSNIENSHQSSLGYYLTEETYIGKNGLSLKLKGLEYGINHNARKRHIVFHGADYATKTYIDQNGILGNSEGCPAVPMELHQSIINLTKNGSCLFIYFPDNNYFENSQYYISDI
tara:strand:+ start:69 stop:776 length:708 start_codon:yes stop_codon:yes gene_type:complete